MMRSLYSGVSGLKNHQTRMDVVGNNISNVNTTGFKSSRVTFSDTLSQTLSGASAPTDNRGGTNPKQIGLGSATSSIDTLFTDGSVQSTGVNTDLCLSGNGLFIVKDGNLSYYTRNGNFKFDNQGYYVNSDGLKVQGWMSATPGESINTNGAATEICIPAGKAMAATATKTATFSNNLNATMPIITSITVTKSDGTTAQMDEVEVDGKTNISAVIALSDGTKQTVSSGAYKKDRSIPVTTTLTVYDSLGAAHNVPILMEKVKDSNEWKVWLSGRKATQTITESDGTTTTINLTQGTLKFTDTGAFDKKNSANGALALSFTNGSAEQKVALDYSNMTQYSGSNTAYGTTDGNAAGTLKSVSIDSAGVITGTYTNGLNVQEAQVAIAQFNNASGLTKTGNSLYTESNNSGTPNIGTISDLGCTATPSALEMSNVDMASELTDMIVTQRGYQSNSKIITVSDELLETLINMKR